MLAIHGIIDGHQFYVVLYFSPDTPWLLLHPGSNTSTHLVKITNGRYSSCDALDIATGSQLLKTTLTESYTILEVGILIKKPHVNFGPAHPDCDQAPSLLMTHDSSEAIARGLACSPFCQVPNPCQLGEVEVRETIVTKYWFLCQCAAPTCNELFLVLHPQLNIVKICKVEYVNPLISY